MVKIGKVDREVGGGEDNKDEGERRDWWRGRQRI